MDPQWSPDGDRLLFTKPPVGEPAVRTLVATVLDVRTWQTTTTLLDVSGLTCAEVECQLTWLPSGTEIAITLAHKGGGEYLPSVPFGIQTFTLDGARARSLPIAGSPTGSASWSPDGRYVVVHGVSPDGQETPGQVVEVATGAVVRRMDGYVMQAAWVDNDRMLVWELDLTDIEKPTAVISLQTRDGAVLERWLPPALITAMPGPFPRGPMAARLGE
jgi:Tol biopolymer transport system component